MSSVISRKSFKTNTIINNAWIVTSRIAKGGFGEVFLLRNVHNKSLAAMKVQTGGKPKNMVSELVWEVYVMTAFRHSRHCPRVIAYMENDAVDMIVMELLGPTLYDMQNGLNWNPIPPGLAALIGRQCLAAVRDLHKCCFVHRDIKPANFAFGLGGKRGQVYLIDFGMSRRYRTVDGRLMPRRKKTGFRGTILYASERAHRYEELGTVDDLISLSYVIIEMLIGKLPWCTENNFSKVQQMKSDYSLNDLTSSLGTHMQKFANHISSLKEDDQPNYRKLDKLLTMVTIENGVKTKLHIRVELPGVCIYLKMRVQPSWVQPALNVKDYWLTQEYRKSFCLRAVHSKLR
uniref:Protein kinase domain-containing protein n=1 Tax=Trichuris muris TaxID=70415 RepID=A0A5S6QZ77_TRIMR